MEPSKRSPQRANGQKLTRRRIPVSCVACRARKLKCNREKPCQNCIVRGDSATATCSYAEKPNDRRPNNPRSDAADMRNRIGRLEKSIRSIMAEKSKHPPSVPPEKGPSESASNDSDVTGQLYSVDTRSTHWDAILHEIGAMKDAWNEENDKSPSFDGTRTTSPSSHRLSIFNGLTQPAERSIILADIPSKIVCDKLVSRFFDEYTPLLPSKYILHKPTFLKQYNSHWVDPSKTRTIWIGLLFSILCLSMYSYIRNKDLDDIPFQYKDDPIARAEDFRIRTAECLVTADITKPKEFLIETLMIHYLAEYLTENDDSSNGVMLMSNVITRLALQQGYHRDPSQYPRLTVFQREIRRRIWAIVNQHELLWAAQSGIPKQVKYAECDTAPISNVYEEELYEEMETMPDSRPLSEPTEIGYMIVKSHVMRAFGNVIEFLHIVESQPYEEVMRLDMILLDVKEWMPPRFQLRPLEEMQDDPAPLVMERFILQEYHHKSICLLHRKYWNQCTSERMPPQYYSWEVSATSAMALLEMQASMHRLSAAGDLLENMKWYHFSMSNHDFLLAAMIVALDLSCERIPQIDGFVCPADKIRALQRSRGIWTEVLSDCRDARRAITVLNCVLDKLKAKPEYSHLFLSGQEPFVLPLQSTSDNNSATHAESWDLRPNVYPFSGSISAPSQACPVSSNNALDDSVFVSFEADIDMPLDFDWDAWDKFMKNDMLPDLSQ